MKRTLESYYRAVSAIELSRQNGIAKVTSQWWQAALDAEPEAVSLLMVQRDSKIDEVDLRHNERLEMLDSLMAPFVGPEMQQAARIAASIKPI